MSGYQARIMADHLDRDHDQVISSVSTRPQNDPSGDQPFAVGGLLPVTEAARDLLRQWLAQGATVIERGNCWEVSPETGESFFVFIEAVEV